VHLDLRISQLEKIRNGPNGILWGWGETDSCKKNRSKKYRDTVPLKGPLGEKTLLSITSKTIGSYYLKSVEITFFQNCETIFWVILPLFANFSAEQTKNCLKNCHWRLCLEWFFENQAFL
jgi:hypothetical protein